MSEYPEEILPKTHFAPQINLETVVSKSNEFVVCRSIDIPLEDAIVEDEDGSEILDLDVLGDSIVGMSVNLMGGHFNESHLRYYTPHKFLSGQYWDGKREIKLIDFVGQYDNDKKAYPLYYSSKVVHRQVLPCELRNTRKEHLKRIREVFQKAAQIFENNVNLNCEIFVNHKPNNLNYWHSQIELKPLGAQDSECFKNNNSFREKIYIQLLSDVFSRKFLKILPTGLTIPTCAYCRLSSRCRI